MSDPILITCPATSQPVKTGFRAPSGSDISHLKGVRLERCPQCGQTHVWDGRSAFWEEKQPAPTGLWHEILRIWRRPGKPLL